MTIQAILKAKGSEFLSISGDASVADAITLLAKKRIGALPVVDAGEVRGIFSERDVIYGIAREGAAVLSRKIAEVMITPAIIVTPNVAVNEALALMTRRRVRHLPVIENDKICGFISIGDLVKYRIEMIETESAAMRDYIAS
jgi:CBS domain-containing protein